MRCIACLVLSSIWGVIIVMSLNSLGIKPHYQWNSHDPGWTWRAICYLRSADEPLLFAWGAGLMVETHESIRAWELQIHMQIHSHTLYYFLWSLKEGVSWSTAPPTMLIFNRSDSSEYVFWLSRGALALMIWRKFLLLMEIQRKIDLLAPSMLLLKNCGSLVAQVPQWWCSLFHARIDKISVCRDYHEW